MYTYCSEVIYYSNLILKVLWYHHYPYKYFPSEHMILSDRDIKQSITDGRIVVESNQTELFRYIHASSMDFRLGNTFKLYEHSKFAVLDPMNPESFAGNMRTITVADGDSFIVQPGEFVLGVTQEKITLPDDLVARVEGRSSLGRLGIIVHSTAGFVDPGFSGTITLEISNLNRLPVALYPGMRVCQLAFEKMTSAADTPYHSKPFSKYQGQVLPEESRLSIDPEFTKNAKELPLNEEVVVG
jgi:dCTP deaminase